MKRPMGIIGLTAAVTTWVAFLLSGTQALLLSGAVVATGVLLYVLGKRFLRGAVLACFVAALFLASYSLYQTRHIAPFARATGETVAVEGLVTQAAIGHRSISYTLRATFPDSELPDTTLALRSFGEMDYLVGDVIAGQVLLDQEGKTPGQYGFHRGIFASGRLMEARRTQEGYRFSRLLIRLRQTMERHLYRHLPSSGADLVSAVALGLQDNIDTDLYSAVNRAGTAHLLTVSGLHLSVLTALLLGGLEKLRMPRRAATFLTLAVALLFAALVGFSPSMMRAFLMTAITLVARSSPVRRGDSLSSLGFAVTLLCLFQPVWVLGRGFWYSAGSTLGIILLGDRFVGGVTRTLSPGGRPAGKIVGLFASAAGISGAAYVFTLPLTILFSGWVPVLSLLANVLIAPFVTPLIGGGILCAVVGGSGWPIRAVAWGTNLCAGAVLHISRLIGSLPFAVLPLDRSWMLFWLGLVVVLILTLFVVRANKRLVSYALLLAVFSFGLGDISHRLAYRNTAQLAVLEGCGVAVLLREKEAVVLGTPSRLDINRLLRYLEFRGVREIRAVIATDAGDQIGSGLLRLVNRYPTDCIIGPNDSYILNQMATALAAVGADVPVYSGGYATLEVLDGCQLTLLLPQGDLYVAAGRERILKSNGNYGILENMAPHTIGLYQDGAVEYLGAAGYTRVVLGQALYGETRFYLPLD